MSGLLFSATCFVIYLAGWFAPVPFLGLFLYPLMFVLCVPAVFLFISALWEIAELYRHAENRRQALWQTGFTLLGLTLFLFSGIVQRILA
ncbi:MAG: hypothetical protein JNL57_05965 [Bacteroidetes bacterium]|nr:hypothetical protein [Bacteroidota bacterium]